MRCPNCNATNRDDAEWCSQCLVRFEDEAGPPSLRVVPGDGGQADPRPQRPGAAASGSGGPALAAVPDPSSDLERLVSNLSPSWTCGACGTANPISENACSACGRSIYEAYGAVQSEGPGVKRSPAVAAGLSMIPGAGHLYLKRTGEGVARMLLFAWWAGMALFLGGGPVGFLRITFASAAAGLIAVSTAEAYRQAEDPRAAPLLSPKAILYVSLALMGVLFIGLIAAFGASTQSPR